MHAKKRSVKKVATMLLAVVLLIGVGVGGTLAWLQATTKTLTNTFTVGKVALTLDEREIKVANDGVVSYGDRKEGITNQYPAIPGASYEKDPIVTVKADSEKCYLFVKFEYTTDASTYYTYTSNLTTANGWIKLDSASSVNDETGITTEVWYRTVVKSDSDTPFELLAKLNEGSNNTLAVNSTAVTNETASVAAAQSLVYTAYAVQSDNVADATAAWALANS